MLTNSDSLNTILINTSAEKDENLLYRVGDLCRVKCISLSLAVVVTILLFMLRNVIYLGERYNMFSLIVN